MSAKRKKVQTASPATKDDASPATLPADGGLDSLPADCVHAEPVSWVMDGRLPLGHCVVIEGKKTSGKTSLLASIAAAVTRGGMLPAWSSSGNDATRCRRKAPKGRVVWATNEETPTTVLARLRAAGADCAQVRLLGVTLEGPGQKGLPKLPADEERLERCLRYYDARLLVLDPLLTVVDPTFDVRVEQPARIIMGCLTRLAHQADTLVAVVRHVGKGRAAHLLDAGLGSTAIGNAARAVLRCDALEPPHGFSLRVIACNLAPPAPMLQYFCENTDGGVKVRWADELPPDDPRVWARPDDPADIDAREDCRRILRTMLADGDRPAKQAISDLQALGISVGTWRRVKIELQIASRCEGARDSRVWYWSLPCP